MIWWFSLVGILIIVISSLLGLYIEKRLDRRNITAELTVYIVVLLWAAVIVGILLERNVLR